MTTQTFIQTRPIESYTARSQTDEDALIQAARRGDLDAFNALVVKYQDRVYNLAYRILGDEAHAADATQEAFIAAYRHIGDFHTGYFYAWLYRIVTNICYDLVRYHKRRPALSFSRLSGEDDDADFDVSAPDDGPETIVQRHELAALLQKHINTLPADQRLVLVLSDVQGLTDREIAAIMRSNVGTVKSRLSRARAKMRRRLTGVQWAM